MYRPILRNASRQLATARPVAITTRGLAAHATPQPFDWKDPLNAQNLFTEEEIAISETAEQYCQERMLPRVLRKFVNCMLGAQAKGGLNRGISRRTL